MLRQPAVPCRRLLAEPVGCRSAARLRRIHGGRCAQRARRHLRGLL